MTMLMVVTMRREKQNPVTHVSQSFTVFCAAVVDIPHVTPSLVTCGHLCQVADSVRPTYTPSLSLDDAFF